MKNLIPQVSIPKIFTSNTIRVLTPIVAGAFLLTSNSSFAQCTIDTNKFNGFTKIGAVELTQVTNDDDNTDGENDGALLVNGTSTEAGQGSAYAFECDLSNAETLTIASHVYNPNASFVKLRVALHNTTQLMMLN